MLRAVDKALILRESAYLKSKQPEKSFQNRLKNPRKILELVEHSSASNSVKLEGRRCYLVSLCAAFEIYWRDFFREMIDEHRIAIEKANHLNKVTFSYSDIREIVGKRLTLGELVATCSVENRRRISVS